MNRPKLSNGGQSDLLSIFISLVRRLPSAEPAWTVGGQLIRAGASVGANYRPACRARSHPDFVAKIAYWLEIVKETGLGPAATVDPLLKEADELTAIFARSTMTARQSANRQ